MKVTGDLFIKAVQASNNGIVITDMNLPDQPLIYVNPSFERMTGYSAEECLGKNCRFLQGTDRDQSSVHIIRDAVQLGRSCRVVLKNFRKDGTFFYNELYLSPIYDEAGRATHFIGIQNDVTAQKTAENLLQRAYEELSKSAASGERELQELTIEIQKQLELSATLELASIEYQKKFLQLQRLEGIGSLAGGIAHDLNNVLSPILMGADILKATTNEEQKKKLLTIIETSAQRGVAMVQQLLNYGRGVNEKSQVSLYKLLQEIEALLSSSFPPHIRLEFVLDESAPLIFGNSTQIYQSIINLCVNARDAMPEAGTLRVTLCCKTFQKLREPERFQSVITVSSKLKIPGQVFRKHCARKFSSRFSLRKRKTRGLASDSPRFEKLWKNTKEF